MVLSHDGTLFDRDPKKAKISNGKKQSSLRMDMYLLREIVNVGILSLPPFHECRSSHDADEKSSCSISCACIVLNALLLL